jgi:hypothetical protein
MFVYCTCRGSQQILCILPQCRACVQYEVLPRETPPTHVFELLVNGLYLAAATLCFLVRSEHIAIGTADPSRIFLGVCDDMTESCAFLCVLP